MVKGLKHGIGYIIHISILYIRWFDVVEIYDKDNKEFRHDEILKQHKEDDQSTRDKTMNQFYSSYHHIYDLN